jgi:hypothetical protein
MAITNKFSDQIFEANIVDINYDAGTCTISPGNSNQDSNITNVPLPHTAGNSNAGIFRGLSVGSRVLAVHTSGNSRDLTLIAAVIPNQKLNPSNYKKDALLNLPNGTTSYPRITEGDLVIKGERGARIKLNSYGDLQFTTVNGGGLWVKRNQNRTSSTLAVEDYFEYTGGSRVISGPVRRMSSDKRNHRPKPNIVEVPLGADPEYAIRTVPYGFFTSSIPSKRTYDRRTRNPELAEHRTVFYEFLSDNYFTGFDQEVARAAGDIGLLDLTGKARHREQGNTLYLSEAELIEIIAGNLLDINGTLLDINFLPLIYSENNRVPKKDLEISYDRARRISRRGVGYHFQLTTNTRTTDSCQSSKNFVFDIDKEGLLKINIPASTDTGNIPFASNANYAGKDDGVEVTVLNPSITEPVPVTLRDENGEIVFPDKRAQNLTSRKTGIKYSSGGESGYFPSVNSNGQSSESRVNPTKYHNMYAAAERLIANTIKVISIPKSFGTEGVLSNSKPFEVAIPANYNTEEESVGLPNYMSVVAVEPQAPAIYHGGGGEDGGMVIAGKFYSEANNPNYSNQFSSTIKNDEVSIDIGEDGQAKPVGGKSVHANMEGSVEVSVGSDNHDKKSILLDTAGSIISWLGRDKNNRSLVVQTDGEVLFNIGGTYPGTDSQDREMTVGRFELRVNVTDKKFVATSFEAGENPGAQSDYIISISEEGLVIAGMKTGKPMIIRNDGAVLIESTENIMLKGSQVQAINSKGLINNLITPSRD